MPPPWRLPPVLRAADRTWLTLLGTAIPQAPKPKEEEDAGGKEGKKDKKGGKKKKK